MKHVKIFETSIGVWDEHPMFDKAVDKIAKELKAGRVEGGANWILDFLGDEYPQSTSFARRVMVRASSKINPRR